MDSCDHGWQMDLTKLDLKVYNAISTVATNVYYQTVFHVMTVNCKRWKHMS